VFTIYAWLMAEKKNPSFIKKIGESILNTVALWPRAVLATTTCAGQLLRTLLATDVNGWQSLTYKQTIKNYGKKLTYALSAPVTAFSPALKQKREKLDKVPGPKERNKDMIRYDYMGRTTGRTWKYAPQLAIDAALLWSEWLESMLYLDKESPMYTGPWPTITQKLKNFGKSIVMPFEPIFRRSQNKLWLFGGKKAAKKEEPKKEESKKEEVKKEETKKEEGKKPEVKKEEQKKTEINTQPQAEDKKTHAQGWGVSQGGKEQTKPEKNSDTKPEAKDGKLKDEKSIEANKVTDIDWSNGFGTISWLEKAQAWDIVIAEKWGKWDSPIFRYNEKDKVYECVNYPDSYKGGIETIKFEDLQAKNKWHTISEKDKKETDKKEKDAPKPWDKDPKNIDEVKEQDKEKAQAKDDAEDAGKEWSNLNKKEKAIGHKEYKKLLNNDMTEKWVLARAKKSKKGYTIDEVLAKLREDDNETFAGYIEEEILAKNQKSTKN